MQFRHWMAILVTAGILKVGLMSAEQERLEEEIQRDLYCKMVRDYKASDGEFGWPAYHGEEQCNER